MAIGPQVVQTVPNTTQSHLNITAPTIIKPSPGFVGTLTVVAGGSGNGAICDVLVAGNAGDANLVAIAPQTQGTYVINFPCRVGICVIPGTGQTLAVSFA